MSTSTKGKGTRATLAASLAAGAQKHFPAGTSLSVGGVMLTLAQVETQLTGYASLRDDVNSARAVFQAKVAAEKAQATAMNAFVGAFVRIVRGSFGNQPDVLADFGLQCVKNKGKGAASGMGGGPPVPCPTTARNLRPDYRAVLRPASA